MRTRFWTAVLAVVVCVAAHAQWTDPAIDIPAFHTAAPASSAKEPAILHGKQLNGPDFHYPWQVKAYQDAAKIPAVLYQLPCYCRCDRAMGHTSLRSCFEGLHGAECDICAREGIYAYQMTRKGWTPKQIRTGIERGDWKSIHLESIGTTSHHA